MWLLSDRVDEEKKNGKRKIFMYVNKVTKKKLVCLIIGIIQTIKNSYRNYNVGEEEKKWWFASCFTRSHLSCRHKFIYSTFGLFNFYYFFFFFSSKETSVRFTFYYKILANGQKFYLLGFFVVISLFTDVQFVLRPCDRAKHFSIQYKHLPRFQSTQQMYKWILIMVRLLQHCFVPEITI